MYKYYISNKFEIITELEFIRDKIDGNHFEERTFSFEDIKKAVKKMNATEDFFKLLPPQKIKDLHFYGSLGYEHCSDMWYEDTADFESEELDFRILCFLAETAYKNPILGIYKVANRVLENYSRRQIHISIEANVAVNKVYRLTGNYYPGGLKGGKDYYRIEVDFSDCTLRSYKNDELIRVRHDYSTLYDLIELIQRTTEAEFIEKYLMFDKNHLQNTSRTKFFINSDMGRVEQIYFNPDAESGEQYVQNVFYYSDIIEALTATTSDYDFFDYLESNCKQYVYDSNEPEFEKIKKKFTEKSPDIENNDFKTMVILCRLALTEEFIKNNLKESEYFGVGIYTLYKIAERFLVGYNNWEFDDNPVEEYPIKPKEKICVASTTVDILDNEYLAEGFIDFDKQEKTLEVAGVVVRREGYVKLSELVEDLQTLEFAEFMSLTESEEKLFLESKTPGRVGYYDYEELRKAAGSGKSEDINRLGEWFSLFGARYWNGEYYDADGLGIYPVYQEIDETGDSFEVVGYSTSKPEVIKKYRGLAEKF